MVHACIHIKPNNTCVNKHSENMSKLNSVRDVVLHDSDCRKHSAMTFGKAADQVTQVVNYGAFNNTFWCSQH